jgi:hypothetical protein
MATLAGTLDLPRCPHCQIAHPHLTLKLQLPTNNSAGAGSRHWCIYVCTTCGGVVSAWAAAQGATAQGVFPNAPAVSAEVPDRPRTYLSQAFESLHAPAGAVMLAASAVDAMLKLRGLTQGSLYARIEKAAQDHLITPEVSAWAHAVRLDANDQRHADESALLPTADDAKRSIDFAVALADILFVLPARVRHGLDQGANQQP